MEKGKNKELKMSMNNTKLEEDRGQTIMYL